MAQHLPLVLVPGLLCSARFFAPQMAALWFFSAVTVADYRRETDISSVAKQTLDDVPPRFALAGWLGA
jgi:hypothetical protein